jgi:drug/metabolite transporter (DMT)-like permease
MAVVLATLFYAVSLNTIKYYLHELKALHITALAFSFTFIPALLLFFHTDVPEYLSKVPMRGAVFICLYFGLFRNRNWRLSL